MWITIVGTSTFDNCLTEDIMQIVVYVGHYSILSTCLLSFIYGCVSWRLIRKFRNFNNYVYMNAILVNIFRLILMSCTVIHCDSKVSNAFRSIHPSFLFAIFNFLTAVYNHWLVVMCYMFYVDIVKVFRKDIKRRYLKSFIFSWGVPTIVFIICGFILMIIKEVVQNNKDKVMLLFMMISLIGMSQFLPVMVNLMIFIKLLCGLYVSKDNASVVSGAKRRKENCRRLSIASAIFILSNITVLTFVIWDALELKVEVRGSTLGIQMGALAIFMPLLKSNRTDRKSVV